MANFPSDIDECQLSSPCDQVCINIEGSFECDCFSGYQPVNNVLGTCEGIFLSYSLFSCFSFLFCFNTAADIDECRVAALENSVVCAQPNTQCLNNEGSYECVCVDGYELVDDKCERM